MSERLLFLAGRAKLLEAADQPRNLNAGFPALNVTVPGPAADKIRQAAAMFGKCPEAYCREYLYWLAAMDLEGSQ